MSKPRSGSGFISVPVGNSLAPLGPRQCAARNRKGERCGRSPICGRTVCHYHGGTAPQTNSAAVSRLAVADAVALVAQDLPTRFYSDSGPGAVNNRGPYSALTDVEPREGMGQWEER
jgi:hypothetical protein